MKRIPLHLLFFAAIALLAVACASIGNPSGGARDEQPPRFVRANPAPNSSDVPVTTDKVTLDFDELVNVPDASQKVVVSPPSKSVPRVAAQGHRVTVTFQDSLLPNTTYTIDFADAIEDNNESNPLVNFSYTFSTGPTVDSLRIAGRVLSARAMEPMQGKIVGVHRVPEPTDSLQQTITPEFEGLPELSDTLADKSRLPLIFHKMFDRVARTDDRGRFSVEGLAPGRYRVYALDDTNSDYLFSSPDEEMAFYETVVTPSTESAIASDTIFNTKLGTVDSVVSRQRTIYLPNDILLRSFLTSRKQQFVSSYARQDSTRINLTFNAPNRPLPTFSLVGEEMPGTDWYTMERSQGADTISLWISNPRIISTDTLRLAVGYLKLDSLNRYVATSDTLRLTTDRPRKSKAKKDDKKKKKDDTAQADSVAPPVPLMQFNLLGGSSLDVDRPLLIQTDSPLARLDTALFRIEELRDTVWTATEPVQLINDSINPRIYRIERPWKYDTKYRLSADTLAMENIYGLSTAPFSQEFSTKAEKEYCSLILNVADWPAGLPAFVELLNQSDEPTRRMPLENGRVRFNNLTPGKFYFRIVADLNGNGVWDSGDIIAGRQPEPAFYYPKSISVKQNWNKEETWNVFDTPADAMKPSALLKNKPTPRKNERTNSNTPEEDEEDEEDFYNTFPSGRQQQGSFR
ncbi:MAG: Ig-like domain-containing protein [Muribaculaceae bacterium]|nr:Ig-like domain-containing protein [Muribaculaceae bacterium]